MDLGLASSMPVAGAPRARVPDLSASLKHMLHHGPRQTDFHQTKLWLRRLATLARSLLKFLPVKLLSSADASSMDSRVGGKPWQDDAFQIS